MRTIKIKKTFKGIPGYVRVSKSGNEIRLTASEAMTLSKKIIDAVHSVNGAHIIFVNNKNT